MTITNHKFNFTVTPQDVDFTRRITIISLANYILNTAGMAATQNNFGLEELSKENLAWVVSRLAFEMKHYPAQNEMFSIETWVEDYGKFFTTRNFKIYDENNSIIGYACSIWAIIDLTTRKVCNLQDKIEWKRFATGIKVDIEKPIKIDDVQPATTPIATHTTAYSDIDFNQHVNFTKYIQWFADTFDLKQFSEKKVIRFDINFIHEALFGEKIYVFRQDIDNKALCEIKNFENKTLSKIRFIWK